MSLTPLQSRFLAVALLLLLMGAIGVFGAWPMWQRYQGLQETIDSHRAQIKRFRAIAASLPAYEAALADFRRRDDVAKVLISAASTSLAAAQLQERVKRTVESSNGQLVSAQSLDAQNEGPYTRVSVNIRVHLTIEALQAVLHRLEIGTPYVIIDEVVVISRNRRINRRRSRRPRARQTRPLDVRMTVSGFMTEERAEGAQQSAARPQARRARESQG